VVHEFGHYGFGLFDEYLGAPQGVPRGLSYPEMCRCIMGHQYSDHKICFDGNHRAYTNQGLWNGRSCWRQIEEWHEGLRGGYYAPVTTPMERGGVVPPEIGNRVGEEVEGTILDSETTAFDARLEVAGPFGRKLGGVLVYAVQKHDGRTLYQGQTRGDGRMELVGIHAADFVFGLKDGARAELRITNQRSSYTLEFDAEPKEDRGPPPLVIVRPELSLGRKAGATVETALLARAAGTPILSLLGDPKVEVPLVPVARPEERRFTGFLPESAVRGGRVTLETVVPDAVEGDVTAATDVVFADLPHDEDAMVASFDGSVRIQAPAGAFAAPLAVAIASTAGPAFREEGVRSAGRVHAFFASGEDLPFRRPLRLAFQIGRDAGASRLLPQRFDPAKGAFVPLPILPSPATDVLLTEIETPGLVALFERL
jgi:hypothetical protein